MVKGKHLIYIALPAYIHESGTNGSEFHLFAFKIILQV